MRATSVIFLILSVILAMVGVGLCFAGASMAEEQGIALFDQVADANDNLIYTYNYAGDGIKKIAIEVGDCDVNIYGGSENDYIELINFTESSYDLSATNLTLSVVDNSSLLRLFAMGSGGINFHGFRHYLGAFDYADKPRTINVYLTRDSAVKQFDLDIGTGNLTLSDIRFTFDLFSEVEDGSITLKNMLTTSDMQLTTGRGSITLDDITARSLNLSTEQGDIDLIGCYTLRGIKLITGEGDINMDTIRPDYVNYSIDLQAPAGEITYYGESRGRQYAVENADVGEEYFLTLVTDRGNITVTQTPDQSEEGDG